MIKLDNENSEDIVLTISTSMEVNLEIHYRKKLIVSASPAEAADDPKNIPLIEQLYLTGLHLEQYRMLDSILLIIMKKRFRVIRGYTL